MEERNETKTSAAQLRAVARYNAKYDRLHVQLPRGTRERVAELTGQSFNAYAARLILDDLDRRERERGKQ